MRTFSDYRGFFIYFTSLILFLGSLVLWAWLTNNQSDTLTDFTQDYIAARNVLINKSIYGSAITDSANKTLGIQGVKNFHPPSSVILFIPLAFLPYKAAFWFWSFLSLALYLVSLAMICSCIGIRYPAALLLQVLLLYWYPFVYGLALGQLSIIIGFLIVSAWFFMKKKKGILAGLLLGASCLLKVYPVFLILFLAAIRSWRTLISSLFAVLIGLLATLAVVSPSDILSYVFEIAPADILTYGAYPLNFSLTGFLYPLLIENVYVYSLADSKGAADILILVISLIIAVLTLIYSHRMLAHKDGFTFGFSLSCATMLLLSPITWAHSLIVLLIPLIFFLYQGFAGGSRRLVWTTLSLLILFSLTDVHIARSLLGIYAPEKIPATIYVLSRTSFWGLWALWVLLYRVKPGLVYGARE